MLPFESEGLSADAQSIHLGLRRKTGEIVTCENREFREKWVSPSRALTHDALEAGDAAVAGVDRVGNFPVQNERAFLIGLGEEFRIFTALTAAFDEL